MESWKKEKIYIRRKKFRWPPGPDEIQEIEAYCVGGREGARAYWLEGDLICSASGDDGSWWETDCINLSWLDQMFEAMGYVRAEAKKKR